MYVTNFCLSTDFNSAIMTVSRKIGVLILIFSMSLLLTSVRANNCETELLHRCISRYRELVKEKPNNEQHCTRVQVRLTILRKISDQVFMNVMLKARQSFFLLFPINSTTVHVPIWRKYDIQGNLSFGDISRIDISFETEQFFYRNQNNPEQYLHDNLILRQALLSQSDISLGIKCLFLGVFVIIINIFGIIFQNSYEPL